MASAAQVLRPFDGPMTELGFARVGNVFVKSLSDDAEGFVGFNSARRGFSPESASLVPAVGVRFHAVAELLTRAGFPQSPHTPTVVTQLQALRPANEYEDLVVSIPSGTSYAHVVDLLRRFGLPFIEQRQTLQQGLDASIGGLGHYTHFTTPIFRYLLGSRDHAIRELELLAQQEAGRPGAWADHVRSVTSGLVQLMLAGPAK